MENPKVERVVLKSSERCLFAISKFLSDDYRWVAEGFGAVFYAAWKKRKDENAKSKGQLGLGQLDTLVGGAVHEFKKSYGAPQLTCQELRGAWDISYDGVPIGTVLRRSDIAPDLLIEIRGVKGPGNLCEYVTDSQGTMLNRYVYRAVGNDAAWAIKVLLKSGIVASGFEPDSIKQKTAGGFSCKEIDAVKGQKKVTYSKSEHIMGWKPSSFISFTTIKSGASNPKGDAFGKVSVMIDLKVLKDMGIVFTYFGTWEGVRTLAVEIKGKEGASKQAFEDIVRTKEILVEGWVPPEAIRQIKDDTKVVWSASD